MIQYSLQSKTKECPEMKKFHNIKQKIIFYVMSVAIFQAVMISLIMSIGNIRSTNTTLLDNMQTTARIASQSISSNLHLLTERMYQLSTQAVFQDAASTDAQKKRAWTTQSSRSNLSGWSPMIWMAASSTATTPPLLPLQTKSIILI